MWEVKQAWIPETRVHGWGQDSSGHCGTVPLTADVGLHLTFPDMAVGVELACSGAQLAPSSALTSVVCCCEGGVTRSAGSSEQVGLSHALILWFQNPSHWATVRSW